MLAADGSKQDDVFVFGTSELAHLLCHYMAAEPARRVAAVTVDREFIDAAPAYSLPVPLLALDDARAAHPDVHNVLVAIGYQRVNQVRRDVTMRLEQEGMEIASFVHRSATIDAFAPIGAGSIVLEQAVIQPFVSLGRGVICWSGVVVAHHSVVGDWCHLAPGAVVCGNVTLGPGVFIGANATVRDGVTIGEHAIVGAGALVTRDVPARAVVPGASTAPDGRDALEDLHRI